MKKKQILGVENKRAEKKMKKKKKPDIQDEILAKWQKTVDLMAKLIGIPAGLIMKVHPSEIEVFVSSDTEGNPYKKGERANLNTGLYCETVMAQRAQLLVPDARKDPEWAHNPDIELGMVSYLGLLLVWPDSEIFGTICVLDEKENSYSNIFQELLRQFKESIEMDMRLLVHISEREEEEKESRKHREHYFRSLLNYLHEGIVVIDRDRRITDVNKSFLTTTGHSREEVIGRHCYEISHGYCEPCGEHGEECPLHEVFETGEPRNYFHMHSRPDGSKAHVGVVLSPLNDKSGKVTNVILAIRDITDLKITEEALRESESKYRLIVENQNDLIVTFDSEYRLLFASPNYCRTFGKKEEELIGKKFMPLIRKDDRDWVAKSLATLSEEPHTCYHEQRAKTIDGWRWFAWSDKAILDKNGKIKEVIAIGRDITDVKQAEEELKSSEERLKILFDFAPDAYYLNDLKGYFIDGNMAAEKILGYKKEELIGKSFLKLNILPPSQIPKAAAALAKNALGKPTGPDEFILNQKDGNQVSAEISTFPIKIKDKTLVLGIVRDITERKKAEEKLRKSEASLAEAQRIAHLGNSDWDIEKNELLWSDEIYRVFGLEPQEFGATYEAFLNCVHPDDREFVKKSVNNALYKGKPYSIDHRILLPGGSERIVHGQAEILFNKTGKAIRMVGTVQDITERKRAEEQVKQLQEYLQLQIDRMPIALIVWDTEFRVQTWNPAADKIFGFTEEEARGKHPYDLIVPKEAQQHVDNIWRRLLEGDTTAHSTNENVTKDGRTIICDWSNTPLKSADGTVMGVLSMVQDITERKKAEEQIKASLKEKEVLLQEVHHRVKNNMQIISSLFNLQSGLIKDKQASEIFKSSQNRVRSMALIHERLYQSKDLTRVDFAEYSQSLTTHLFSSYGINTNVIKFYINIKDIFLDINTAIPCSLIINELVSNSLKHAFPNNNKGEIKITMHPLDKNEIELIVSDDGIGIPKEVDFRDTDSLGLRLVTILAEDQLHGAIRLKRTRGTSFSIRFRMKR